MNKFEQILGTFLLNSNVVYSSTVCFNIVGIICFYIDIARVRPFFLHLPQICPAPLFAHNLRFPALVRGEHLTYISLKKIHSNYINID